MKGHRVLWHTNLLAGKSQNLHIRHQMNEIYLTYQTDRPDQIYQTYMIYQMHPMHDIWDRSEIFRYKEANGQCVVVSPYVCTDSSHIRAWK